MPFTPADKNPGDLARAQEWNNAMHEVERLENAKVNRTGDTMTGPLTTGNLKIGNWPANPNGYVFFGGINNDQSQAGNYALLQGTNAETGRTFLNSPVDIQFRIANGTKMVLSHGGNLGIGTSAPNYTLDVRGEIGSNTTKYHSDLRWKKNVRPLSGALDRLKQLRGVEFEWRKDEFEAMNFPAGRQIGLVAQEVEAVVPQVVSTDSEGFKSVAYANLVALLVEAVNELQQQVETLTAALDIAQVARANS